ncbi:hypothetical protein Moror_2587 [Moniliophthora roreri MCA 2997]|uniref:Uncharacterized protein n=2 Tax=Moniliophthora roreri TaxID=221103 RepID=V2WXD4_MONRO|nr:hypothetical protein Moror_2587 [Moniliophthora roreri MCA 2997]
MAPLPLPMHSSLPTTVPAAAVLTSPSSAILESFLTNSTSSLPLPLLITFLVLITLYILIPRIYNWRYPCQSVDTLEEKVYNLEKLIQSNNSVSGRKNALKECAAGFRERLKIFRNQINTFKSRTEPPRTNLFVWAVFRWMLVREIDACRIGLNVLEAEVQDKLSREGGSSDGKRGLCASAIAIDVVEAAPDAAIRNRVAATGIA